MTFFGYGPYMSRDFCIGSFGFDPPGDIYYAQGFDLLLFYKDEIETTRNNESLPVNLAFYSARPSTGSIAGRLLDLGSQEEGFLRQFGRDFHNKSYEINVRTESGMQRVELLGTAYRNGVVLPGDGYNPVPNNRAWYFQRATEIRLGGVRIESEGVRIEEDVAMPYEGHRIEQM